MKQLIADFSKHIRHAVEIGQNANLTSFEGEVKNVLVSGLGGSGIGGTVVSEILASHAQVPILVNKNYQLPAYVNEHTLVIASSYSGNTEETLEAFTAAEKAGAEIACITGGGKLLEKAETKGLNHIVIPGGNPPRSMFGYSFTEQFFILKNYGIIGNEFEADLLASADLLDAEEENIQQEAKAIAEKLKGTCPIVYSTAPYAGVSVRFRQQLNENSKMLGWSSPIPEMNHNELVGWAGASKDQSVVFFSCEDDYERNALRAKISRGIMEKYTSNITEVVAKGATQLQRSFYLVHMGDWISFYLAEMNGVDVVEVNVIDHLKGELAKV